MASLQPKKTLKLITKNVIEITFREYVRVDRMFDYSKIVVLSTPNSSWEEPKND